MKEGCVRRSTWLNTLPRPGKFESLGEYNIQNGTILWSLILEWRRFIGVLISAISQKPRTPLSQLKVFFCKGESQNSKSELSHIWHQFCFAVMHFWKRFQQAEISWNNLKDKGNNFDLYLIRDKDGRVI